MIVLILLLYLFYIVMKIQSFYQRLENKIITANFISIQVIAKDTKKLIKKAKMARILKEQMDQEVIFF